MIEPSCDRMELVKQATMLDVIEHAIAGVFRHDTNPMYARGMLGEYGIKLLQMLPGFVTTLDLSSTRYGGISIVRDERRTALIPPEQRQTWDMGQVDEHRIYLSTLSGLASKPLF